jgi:GTP-binding protein Era
MSRYLNRTATSTLTGVDLVAFVVDAGHWTEEDALVLERIRESRRPVLLVVNKIDTIRPREKLLPLLAKLSQRAGIDEVIPVSARTGDNCKVLEGELLRRLPEGNNIYPEDQISDRPERFFAAELIREQITRRYHKELPYAVTVEIEEFDERPHILRIGAVIWVERPNQKGILLGRGGLAMKEMATEARRELESFFQKKVFLRLWVKVKKSWSSDQTSLSQLGYTE